MWTTSVIELQEQSKSLNYNADILIYSLFHSDLKNLTSLFVNSNYPISN